MQIGLTLSRRGDPTCYRRQVSLTAKRWLYSVRPEVHRFFAAVLGAAAIVSATSVISACARSAPPRGVIAFVAADSSGEGSDISVVDLRASGGRRRLTGDGTFSSIAWSPSGRQIAFVEDDYEREGVWLMKADGSRRKRLVDVPFLSGLAWSPDGARIAVFSGLGGAVGIISARGRPQGPLRIPGKVGVIYGVRWAPDGKAIVVWVARDVDKPPMRMYSLAVDGREKRYLARGGWPDWSPDRKEIAFAGVGGLWLMNADGSHQRLLARGRLSDPAWSPSGKEILFVKFNEHPNATSLGVMNANGERVRLLAQEAAISPAWSPDGKHIAYTFTIRAPITWGLALMNDDGTHRKIMYESRREFAAELSPPAWQPVR